MKVKIFALILTSLCCSLSAEEVSQWAKNRAAEILEDWVDAQHENIKAAVPQELAMGAALKEEAAIYSKVHDFDTITGRGLRGMRVKEMKRTEIVFSDSAGNEEAIDIDLLDSQWQNGYWEIQEKRFYASQDIVIAKYPDSAVNGSPFNTRMREIDEAWAEAGDYRAWLSSKPELIAEIVEEELEEAERKAITAREMTIHQPVMSADLNQINQINQALAQVVAEMNEMKRREAQARRNQQRAAARARDAARAMYQPLTGIRYNQFQNPATRARHEDEIRQQDAQESCNRMIYNGATAEQIRQEELAQEAKDAQWELNQQLEDIQNKLQRMQESKPIKLLK